MMEKIEEEKRPRIRYQNARYDFELNLKPMQKILQFSTFLSQSPKLHPSYRTTIEQLYFIRKSLFGIHFVQHV